MTTAQFARVARTVLAGQIVTLSFVLSAVAGPGQDTASPTGAGGITPDCRESAGEVVPSPATPQSLDRAATDASTWESLGTARFMAGDVRGALDAWNRVGQPRVRCVNVEGLVRTPRWAVIEYLNSSAGELLTAETFARFERRLDELSFASRPRLRYDPVGGGVATITPIVTEGDVLPQGIQGWGAVGVRAAFLQEVQFDISSPAGRSEVWTPSYRWNGQRPRVMLRLEAPAPGRLPGIVRLHTFVESQTYRYAALGEDTFRQPRQRVGAAISDWITSWLRWEGGTAFDRIDSRSYLALEGSLNARVLDDRVAVILTAGQWSGTDDRTFSGGEFFVTARSTAMDDAPVLTTSIGVARASESAPLAVWPGSSSGEGRNSLLRAHPLRRDSVITGEVFGRNLIFTTTEFEYPFQTRVGQVGVAAFVDAARASRRLVPTLSSPFHVDVGTGVRFKASGAGKVRLDIGYGIRDGRVRLSAGYAVPWGRR